MMKIKNIGEIILLFILPLTLSLLSACKSTSGLLGNVEYAEGDCMPMVDTDRQQSFNPYNGELYAFRKSWLDSVKLQNMDELQKGQNPVQISNGLLNLLLPPGTYVIMPAGMYQYSEDNTITIPAKGRLNKDFVFFKCLTY